MSRLISLAAIVALLLHTNVAQACYQAGAPPFDGGVGGFEGGVSVSVGRITDRTWEPVTIAGQPVPEGSGLSLTVSFEGRVEGTTGCNRFTGTADLDAGWMQLRPLAVTEMACVEQERMEREALWLKGLGEARGFVVSPEGLWLTREDWSVATCLQLGVGAL
jgi:heat shock protein HslJ